MRDRPSDPLDDRQSVAINKLKAFVVGIAGAGLIAARVLERYGSRGYVQGWQVPVGFSDGFRRNLYLLIDGDYPYTPPRVAIADGPGILAWPHLEADGFLCTLPPDAAVSSEDPAGVAAYVLGEACSLIEESIREENVDDFREEFLSYWGLATNQGSRNFISLLEPQGPGRRVHIWRGRHIQVVGESPCALQQWLTRWGVKKGEGREFRFHDGVLIWLPTPLVPADYPNTTADVWHLAQEESPAVAETLEELAGLSRKEIDVVLGANTVNGACFAAVTVRPPPSAGAPKRQRDPLMKGFRPGRIPRSLLVDRYLSGTGKVTKANVERADHLWIHGRDRDDRQGRMRKARVAILGCGSVGGPVARILAQAGVGNLLLVDLDSMDWSNVGRHELGASSVNGFKAPELAREIEKAYPHLGEITWWRERVGLGARDLMRELKSYDLIVSTMGNWQGESYLNDFQQETDGYPPILYGWVEPNVSAAHALLMPRGDACLRCGISDKGRPDRLVTNWPNGGDTLQAPTCGALFTPYGPSELCWAHALITEAAIDALTEETISSRHRVWIGLRSRVERAGGCWSADWLAEMGDPGIGGRTVERGWPASDACPVCARRGRAA